MFYLVGRFLRYVFFGVDLVLVSVFVYALSLLPRRWTASFFLSLFRLWCRSFVRFLDVDLRLHQMNHKPLPDHYILIANHPSAFEDIGIPALFPVFPVAKQEVQDWWIVGRVSAAAGTLYVKREERESRRVAYTEFMEAVQEGRNVAVFPEGGCKGRRIFESFRYGPFDISLHTGVPILPVFLHYESQDDFEWRAGESVLQKIWHILSSRNRRAHYYVHDALDPHDYADKEAFTRDVHDLYLRWQARYLG